MALAGTIFTLPLTIYPNFGVTCYKLSHNTSVANPPMSVRLERTPYRELAHRQYAPLAHFCAATLLASFYWLLLLLLLLTCDIPARTVASKSQVKQYFNVFRFIDQEGQPDRRLPLIFLIFAIVIVNTVLHINICMYVIAKLQACGKV
ncbi:unnamed protein product [Ceratitis capitata]|uniref:(Mediterranean fruit fly) hypothetical protein n=1 Tax=Ceratitis capitata TaxID=7213 RepID=A0A811U6X6_CERCA|nr:unnamed protein product [Ceratitis capitata]